MTSRIEPHHGARSVKAVLVAFAGSAIAIPLFFGLATNSYLFAAVAFCVWTSLFMIVFGIIVSSRVANMPTHSAPTASSATAHNPRADHRPADDDPKMAAWIEYRDEESSRPWPGSHLPNGWLLPMRVTLRPEPPPDVASAAGKRVLLAASIAFGLALLGGVLAFSAFGSSSATATAIGILAAWTAVYDLVVLLLSRHSLRGGMPRPTLDRPSSLISVFIPVVLLGVFARADSLAT